MSQEPYGVVYEIKCIENNKRYFGKTSYKDPIKYIEGHFKAAFLNNRYKDKLLYRAIRKYGVNKFTYRIVGKCYSHKELSEAEIACMQIYDTVKSIYGYNVTCKRDGIDKNSDNYDQWLKKMSDVTKGSNNGMYGRKHSEKAKNKMSKNSIGIAAGNKNPMYDISMLERLINKHGEKEGKRKYKEWKIKQSKINRGKGNPMYGKKHSDKARRGMSDTKVLKNYVNKDQLEFLYKNNVPLRTICEIIGKGYKVIIHRLKYYNITGEN